MKLAVLVLDDDQAIRDPVADELEIRVTNSSLPPMVMEAFYPSANGASMGSFLTR